MKTKARSEAACVLNMHEQRKLVYALHPEEEDEALRMLIYKEFGCVLMVDNVVNWYMDETTSVFHILMSRTNMIEM